MGAGWRQDCLVNRTRLCCGRSTESGAESVVSTLDPKDADVEENSIPSTVVGSRFD